MQTWLLAQQAQIEAIKTEVIGMEVENQICVSRNETLAYTEKDFSDKAQALYGIYNDIMINR